MSAIPILEPIMEPAAHQPRSSFATHAAPAPVVITRRRSKSKAKTISMTEVGTSVIAFVIVAGIASFFVSLSGNVMVEAARRDSIRSTEKARYAARQSAILREQVQGLTSAKAVDDWAKSNGFIAAGMGAASSGH
jgi:uncharacterized membrane protein